MRAARSILLCSATLTAKGAVKAAKVFRRTDWKVIQVPAVRDNLHFRTTDRNIDRFLSECVKSGLTPAPAPAIAFFTWKSTADGMAETVQRTVGEPVLRYHASLKDKTRKAVQKEWTDGTKWVFASKAFGMGIDKPNVRTIFHAQVPTSILDYAQEVGRAGRDGKPSFCYLPTYEELGWGKVGELGDAAHFLVSRNYPSHRQVRQVWNVLRHNFHGSPGWHKIDPKKMAATLWRNSDDHGLVRKAISWLAIAEMVKKKSHSTAWSFVAEQPMKQCSAKDRKILDNVMAAVREHGALRGGSYIVSSGAMDDYICPAVGLKGWKEKLKKLSKNDLLLCKWPTTQSTQIQVVSDTFDDFDEAAEWLKEATSNAFKNLQRMIDLAHSPAENRASLIEDAISLDLDVFNAEMEKYREELAAEAEKKRAGSAT